MPTLARAPIGAIWTATLGVLPLGRPSRHHTTSTPQIGQVSTFRSAGNVCCFGFDISRGARFAATVFMSGLHPRFDFGPRSAYPGRGLFSIVALTVSRSEPAVKWLVLPRPLLMAFPTMP